MQNLAIFHEIQEQITGQWKSVGGVEHKRSACYMRFAEVLGEVEREGILQRKAIGIQGHWHLCRNFEAQMAVGKSFVVASSRIAPRIGLQLVTNLLKSAEVFQIVFDIAIVLIEMQVECARLQGVPGAHGRRQIHAGANTWCR